MKMRNPFEAFKDKFIILFFDPQVGLYFTIIARHPERDHIMLYPEDVAKRLVNSPRFRQHWLGYEYEVHRYEALKEFEDHHRRQHWNFENCLVQFFGTSKQMDWVAELTGNKAGVIDPRTGMVLDWDDLPKPELSRRLRGAAS